MTRVVDAANKTGQYRWFMEQQFAEPPASVQILPKPGTYKHPRYGEFTISKDDIREFVDNHNAHVYQTHIALDAEHETKLSGAVAYVRDMQLVDGGAGGATADIEWTDRGKEMVASDRFKYISPEWYDFWRDPADSTKSFRNVLIGGAITTRPFYKESALKPLVASEMDYDETEVEDLSITPEAFADNLKLFLDPGDVHVNGLMGHKEGCDCAGCKAMRDSKAAREVSDKEREKLAEQDKAMPDGGYPIANAADLKNAIQAIGRAKNPDAVKAHIKRRARALGATDLLPDSWQATERTSGTSAGSSPVTKRQQATRGGHDMNVEDAIAEGKLAPALRDWAKKYAESDPEGFEEYLDSTPDVQADQKAFGERLHGIETDLRRSEEARKAAEERVEALEADSRVKRFREVIAGRDPAGDGAPHMVGNVATHERMLGLLAKEFGEDSDEFRDYVETQRANAKAIHEAGLFTEKGKASRGEQAVADSALKQFNERVDALVSEGKATSRGEAIVQIGKADPALYAKVRSEQRREE